ncbi:hypothetical protein L596_012635 [Steinernema carpocapsae]|uniref:Uncharacterized protein n=1 Tax=Steinernema carpocapsae TaxID=34508 RepID=A0A4U5NYH2_STECR|nr:hypothetical protein L596_012635 [Steinernema carpocapsae]
MSAHSCAFFASKTREFRVLHRSYSMGKGARGAFPGSRWRSHRGRVPRSGETAYDEARRASPFGRRRRSDV